MALRITSKTLMDNFKLTDLQDDLQEIYILAGGKPSIISLNSDAMIVRYDSGTEIQYNFTRDTQGRIIKITNQKDGTETIINHNR